MQPEHDGEGLPGLHAPRDDPFGQVAREMLRRLDVARSPAAPGGRRRRTSSPDPAAGRTSPRAGARRGSGPPTPCAVGCGHDAGPRPTDVRICSASRPTSAAPGRPHQRVLPRSARFPPRTRRLASDAPSRDRSDALSPRATTTDRTAGSGPCDRTGIGGGSRRPQGRLGADVVTPARRGCGSCI